MTDQPFSRRAALGYAGAGVAAAALPQSAATVPAAASTGGMGELLAPLGPGSELGHWRVETWVEPMGGAACVVMLDHAGRRFQLDVCARDPSPTAQRGPATTDHFEIFVANQGDGATGTYEDHGLCAMALGEIIRANEARVDRSPFSTQAERSDPRRHVG